MLRWATFGLICTSSAKAAPYCTRLDAVSMAISVATKAILPNERAQAASAAAAIAEPPVITRPAPKRSIHFPIVGAARPPIRSAADSAPNIHSEDQFKSLAMLGARILKL